MRRLALLLACALLACGQHARRAFAPPDGHWWLAASQSARDGYFVGWFHCHDRVQGAVWPINIANVEIEQKISGYYQRHPAGRRLPVTEIIAKLFSTWRRTGAYKFAQADPKDEWDGQFWWGNVDDRIGIVEGFLSCQAAESQPVSAAPPRVLVTWINQWYGVDPTGRNSDMQGPRMNQKLSVAILAAEAANP